MKCVSKLVLVLGFLSSTFVFGQAASEKLKTEQSRLEKKINNTKSLLDKSKKNTETSLNELRLIDNQIKFREELVNNFDNQVRGAEMKVIEKGSEIKNLQEKLTRLKEQYKAMLIYAYKHRNKFGRLMFIFASNNYNQAIKRGNYLERVADIQQKQFLIIRQHQGLIKKEISSIEQEKQYKMQILMEQKKEKVYKKFKQEETKLLAQLREDEKKKEVLKQKINAAIQKEIAAAEAKRVKDEAAAKKKASASTTTSGSGTKPAGGTTTAPTTEKKEVAFTETKESAALSKSFEGNKGKLPWPVDKGSITEGFGKNPHPTLDNVFTNNNGIDIRDRKSAQVRAVFEGEVTSVLNIPGAGKVVIIKHGNYRTVYSNLQDTYVKAGTKVTTKQSIGSLLVKDGSSTSVAHFEIHQVVGTAVQCLNPSLWVTH